MESLLPLLLIFAVMMLPLLWMSSRQRKAQQKQMELVKQLGVGDEVRTHSGFYGLIVEEYGDIVILESENGAQTKWARQAIAAGVDPVADEAADEAAESEGEQGVVDGDQDIPGVTVDEEREADHRRDER